MFRIFLFGFDEYGKAVFQRAFELNVDQGGSKIFFATVCDECFAAQVGKLVEKLIHRSFIDGAAIRSLPDGLLG